MKLTLALLLVAACVAAPTADRPLTVSEVWARHHELDGKLIRVEGVIEQCYRLGGPLKESLGPEAKHLNVGTSESFDVAVQQFVGKRIVVAGRLRTDCMHVSADEDRGERDGSVIICTDRASMIMNPRIVGLAR